ncbi:MAG: ABC transporter ATP-binding protein [Syntrophobacterales bacterium]|jgi:phospholipid/cholesterol/gamma-HCH transport system ATP-binding protein
MITVEDIYKSFNGFEVLRGASLQVDKGEIVALIGKSGYGKSVLMKHVAGLLKPDRGRVLVDGQDISRLKSKELGQLRGRFGFLFQGGALFDSLTVFDNVAFPLREKTKLAEKEISERVFSELDQVGLTGSERKYPAEISGGMIKRAALARSLVREPEIMFFDEPTTGLDPITANNILALISSCHQRLKFTGIIVTHQIPKIFGIVEKVALLDEGRVLIAGSPDEILASDNPVVRQFLGNSIEGPKTNMD